MDDILTSKLLLSISLALLGGLARVLRKGQERSMPQVLGALVAAVFVGVVAYLFIQDWHIPEGMKVAFVGASGYSSGSLLPIIENWVIGEARKRHPENK